MTDLTKTNDQRDDDPFKQFDVERVDVSMLGPVMEFLRMYRISDATIEELGTSRVDSAVNTRRLFVRFGLNGVLGCGDEITFIASFFVFFQEDNSRWRMHRVNTVQIHSDQLPGMAHVNGGPITALEYFNACVRTLQSREVERARMEHDQAWQDMVGQIMGESTKEDLALIDLALDIVAVRRASLPEERLMDGLSLAALQRLVIDAGIAGVDPLEHYLQAGMLDAAEFRTAAIDNQSG